MRKTLLYIFTLYIVGLLAACSTTSHLPENETLYIGIDKVKVHDQLNTPAEETAVAEVEAALDYAPNGA
ncbi:MAG: hypothetical protein IKQ62_01800, partial [Bacteroidaceae bacterium]|nr:hypothetical protein [Bacteroidaceae bacterium]